MTYSDTQKAELKSFRRVLEIRETPILGGYDAAHLREFHKYIFQDTPEHGPGEVRPTTDSWHKNRNLEGTKTSYPVRYETGDLDAKMDKMLKGHGGVRGFKGLPPDKFSEKMADLYSSADYIHPFREGNSRTLRVFTGQLAKEAGYKLDWGTTKATQKIRNDLYKARDREVTLRKFPDLNEKRAMATKNREEYEAYMYTLRVVEDAPSLKSIIKASLSRNDEPSLNKAEGKAQSMSIDDAANVLKKEGPSAKRQFQLNLTNAVLSKDSVGEQQARLLLEAEKLGKPMLEVLRREGVKTLKVKNQETTSSAEKVKGVLKAASNKYIERGLGNSIFTPNKSTGFLR